MNCWRQQLNFSLIELNSSIDLKPAKPIIQAANQAIKQWIPFKQANFINWSQFLGFINSISWFEFRIHVWFGLMACGLRQLSCWWIHFRNEFSLQLQFTNYGLSCFRYKFSNCSWLFIAAFLSRFQCSITEKKTIWKLPNCELMN